MAYAIGVPVWKKDKGDFKMIFLNAPISQDKIIDLLNNYNEDGLTFKFKEKQGNMKLLFETNASDLDAAAKAAKKAIKAQPWGTVLYFQAGVEK